MREDSMVAAEAEVMTLPFDQYQRYKLIQEIVARVCPRPRPLILDVGGWPGTLRRFLPDARVVIADVSGQAPNMVRADGTRLPFANGQFDLVVSSDTFEHIPPSRRQAFLRELLRVGQGTLVLGAPFDTPGVRAAEAVLRELIRDKYPASYRFIEEHDEYGLPDLEATLDELRSAGCRTSALPNGYLHHWLPMLSLYFTLQWRSPYEPFFDRFNAFYNATCYRDDNRAPSYRTTVVATQRDDLDLDALGTELCQPPGRPPGSAATDWPQLTALLQAVELEIQAAPREPMRRILDLEALVDERTAWAQSLQREVAAHDATIAELQAALAARSRLARTVIYLQSLLARRRRLRSLGARSAKALARPSID